MTSCNVACSWSVSVSTDMLKMSSSFSNEHQLFSFVGSGISHVTLINAPYII